MNTPDPNDEHVPEELPEGLPENLPEAPGIIGISSASGPSEHQEEIDQWIEEGGMPEFDDS